MTEHFLTQIEELSLSIISFPQPMVQLKHHDPGNKPVENRLKNYSGYYYSLQLLRYLLGTYYVLSTVEKR